MSIHDLQRPREITCAEADALRPTLRPLAGVTNWVGGEALFPHLPPVTETTWSTEDYTPVMYENLDADGCRHWVESQP